MAGFELLDLHDFPGQGTALVGILDTFWEDKGYIKAAEFRRFCNNTVIIARLKKRVFSNDETLRAEIEAAHFGPQPLGDVSLTWRLVADNGAVKVGGKLPAQTVPIGNGRRIGSIAVDLDQFAVPCTLQARSRFWGTPYRERLGPVDLSTDEQTSHDRRCCCADSRRQSLGRAPCRRQSAARGRSGSRA